MANLELCRDPFKEGFKSDPMVAQRIGGKGLASKSRQMSEPVQRYGHLIGAKIGQVVAHIRRSYFSDRFIRHLLLPFFKNQLVRIDRSGA